MGFLPNTEGGVNGLADDSLHQARNVHRRFTGGLHKISCPRMREVLPLPLRRKWILWRDSLCHEWVLNYSTLIRRGDVSSKFKGNIQNSLSHSTSFESGAEIVSHDSVVRSD